MHDPVTVRTLHRILTRLCAAGEAQAALETARLLNADRDPDSPGAVVGIWASQKTISIEGEIILRINGPTL